MSSQAIAQHLNVAESAITKVENWANCLFVVIRGLGARFVSKKVMKNSKTKAQVQKLNSEDSELPSCCYTAGRASHTLPIGATLITNAHKQWSTGYLAKISRGETIGTISRDFLQGDRSNLSRAGNGDIAYYELTDGFYEADSVTRSYQSEKFYIQIKKGEFRIFEAKENFIAHVWGLKLEELKKERAKQAKILAKQLEKEESKLGDLPDLIGSPKQINWAKEIRLKKLKEVETQKAVTIEYQPKNKEEEAAKRTAIEKLEEMIEGFSSITSCRFWIDNRDFNFASNLAWDLAQEYLPTRKK